MRLALQALVTNHRRNAHQRPEHFDIYFRQLHLLPDNLVRTGASRHKDYCEEWIRLLHFLRPDIDQETAFVLVETVLIGLSDLARTPGIDVSDATLTDIDNLSMCVLLTADAP